MKIIHPVDLKRYGVIDADSPDSVNYVLEKVESGWMNGINRFEESGINRPLLMLDTRWRQILDVLDYETEGKRILDLGCGATGDNVESVKHKGHYEPWLGRFIYCTKDKTGIEYVGVDCGDLSGEEFDYRRMDLLEDSNLLKEFPENYFDLAVAFMLFNSPELERRTTGLYRADASRKSGEKLASLIVPQLERIVKPNGFFLWNGSGMGFSI